MLDAPAFPCEKWDVSGMTLREYALIHIAAGYLAKSVNEPTKLPGPKQVREYAEGVVDALFGEEAENV